MRTLTFTKGTFNLDAGAIRGKVPTDCVLCCGLSIDKRRHGYVVSHADSGKRINTFRTLRDAKKFVGIILPITDWTAGESQVERLDQYSYSLIRQAANECQRVD